MQIGEWLLEVKAVTAAITNNQSNHELFFFVVLYASLQPANLLEHIPKEQVFTRWWPIGV